MPTRVENFKSLTGIGLRWDDSDATLECTSPHALTRAAGYLKHVLGQKGERVLFRGQTANWKPCVPSLFRPTTTVNPIISQSVQSRRLTGLKRYLETARSADAFIRGTKYPYDHAHEAILQHYGIKTPWVDVVDNIWVALWFAVKKCVTAKSRFVHWHFTASDETYGYILLMSPGEDVKSVDDKPGLWETDDCELIDLRIAAPSLYVRPHAQHGLLLRQKKFPPGDVSIDSKIVGTIKVRADTARTWLGAGYLHDPHVVFPPPHYDAGYARLLESAPPPSTDLGGIAIVFA